MHTKTLSSPPLTPFAPAKWKITKFDCLCDINQCLYQFKIVSEPPSSAPAFSTYCSGFVGADLTPCKENKNVTASVKNNPDYSMGLEAVYVYEKEGRGRAREGYLGLCKFRSRFRQGV